MLGLSAEAIDAAAVAGALTWRGGWRWPRVTVNGDASDAPRSQRNLLSYLRFDLGLTGSKYGCGEGLCGSCTVLVDGQPLRACMTTVGRGRRR